MRYLLIYLTIYIFFGCSNVEKIEYDVKSISFNCNSLVDTLKTSVFIEEAHVVPLETTEDCLIGSIRGIKINDSFIFVSDGISLYKFNSSGGYIAKISKCGMGPDEYVNISSFDIDTIGNAYILSNNDRCIYKYDWEGRLLDKLEMDYFAWQISLDGRGEHLAYVGNDLSDKNRFKISRINCRDKGFLKINPALSKYLHLMSEVSVITSKNDSTIQFCEPFNDTVYTVTGNVISREYVCDYGGHNISNDVLNGEYDNIMTFNEYLKGKGFIHNIGIFLDSGNYFFNQFASDDGLFNAVYEMSNSKSYVSKILCDDILFCGFVIDPQFVNNTHSFISVIEPIQLKEHLTKSHIKLDNNKLFPETKGFDLNPIIYIAKLK